MGERDDEAVDDMHLNENPVGDVALTGSAA